MPTVHIYLEKYCTVKPPFPLPLLNFNTKQLYDFSKLL